MSVNKININKEKLKDLELRDIQLNKETSKMTGYPSIDKPWLKFYNTSAILSDVSDKSIYEYMKECNERRQDSLAIKYFSKKITFKELFNKIDYVANAFIDAGVKEKDIVTLAMPNIPENIVCLYALNKIGAVANMVDLRLKDQSLLDAINDADSKVIVATDLFAKNLDEIFPKTNLNKVIIASPADSLPPLIKLAYRSKCKELNSDDMKNFEFVKWNDFENSGKNDIRFNHFKTNCDDGICILHTSGTTGKAKGVVLTNKNFNAMIEQYKYSGLDFSKGEKFLSQVPPFLAYSTLMAIHLPLTLGMYVDLLPNYEPEKFAKNISKHKPNHVIAGPADWKNFLNTKPKKNYSYLKTLASGSDKLNVDEKIEINNILAKGKCKYPIIEGYGMTEASSAVVTNLPQCDVKGSVGIPLPKMNICIYDNNEEKELPCSTKQKQYKGEICFNGPTVMKGYYNNIEETNKVLKKHSDGKVWLHSGDIGYIDENGVLYLDGRMKRIIVRHDGLKVSPFDIEKVINSLNFVENVCVVGIDDKLHGNGQVPVANIVLKDISGNEDDKKEKIKQVCEEKLSNKSQPWEYEIIDKLPLTPVGKVDYRALQDMNKEKFCNKVLKKK